VVNLFGRGLGRKRGGGEWEMIPEQKGRRWIGGMAIVLKLASPPGE